MPGDIFITGGTGYLGKRMIRILLNEGCIVTALVRAGSEKKLPAGCLYVIADPFSADSFESAIKKGSTFIQLLGVSHPGPSKKDLFYTIDFASVKASVDAAIKADCSHFIYVSVAQTPTKIMADYQHCRAECEQLITQSNMYHTIIRPWYIIGPGHYWPLFFLPFFNVLERIPKTAAKARLLRLVYLKQMLLTIQFAVKYKPAQKQTIIEIDEIRRIEEIIASHA